MKILKSLGIVLGITVSIFAVSFIILAFTYPTVAPTGGNIAKPITTVGGQHIGGKLSVQTILDVWGSILVGDYININGANGRISANVFYYTSDIREKNNIMPISNSLVGITKLDPISYYLKDNDYRSLGLSAQQVREYFPEAVYEDSSGKLSIDPAGLISLLVGSIKEQQGQIDDLKNQIELLKLEK